MKPLSPGDDLFGGSLWDELGNPNIGPPSPPACIKENVPCIFVKLENETLPSQCAFYTSTGFYFIFEQTLQRSLDLEI